MAKILVTGATGYIGRRLIASLLDKQHDVYALVRIRGTDVFPYPTNNLQTIWGDLQDSDSLEKLPEDLDIAYYLVHSMGTFTKDLAETEVKVAQNFIKVLRSTKVKQIIYLSGIIDENYLSVHLQSRLLVEQVFKESGIPTTVLRASIIIGSGSASFEIIRDLVEKLPIMVAPKWIKSKCQPIAVKDVIFYLNAVIDNPKCFNQTFDIGGPEVLSFKEVLLKFAESRRLTRYIFTVPVLTPRLSSYWLVFITSVRFSLASYLVESMQAETTCKNKNILEIFDHKCISYQEAIHLAFMNLSQNEVISTWMDTWEIDVRNPDIQQYLKVPTDGVLIDKQVVHFDKDPKSVLKNIWRIGGDTGWYSWQWPWKVRGLIDKLVGGTGLNRGRRHPSKIQPGDSIDFWRVLKADEHEMILILYAEMKVPGDAWLEFRIEKKDVGYELVQQATFRPRGLLGRVYWYFFLPFHFFIFRSMAYQIVHK